MRSLLRSTLLLGSLLLAALWFCRPPAPAHAPAPHEPEPNRALPALSLIAAGAVIVLATTLWLVAQQWGEASERNAAARAMTGGDPTRAATLMIRYGCAGCHTIPGVPGADGQVGGPLADMRKRVFIAGVLRNTAGNLIDWIVQPQVHDPHTGMPMTGINRDEARDIAAWLYSQ